jgi:hypothetical protein
MGTKVSVDGPCACCDIILTRSVAFGCESYSIGITNIKGQPFAWLRPTFQGCFRHLPTFQILNVEIGLTIWLFNSSPWKDLPIFKFGKPSISMGHGLPWQTVSHNQRVSHSYPIHIPYKVPLNHDKSHWITIKSPDAIKKWNMCRPCSCHKKPSFTHNNHLRSSRLEHPPLEQCWETHYFRWLNSGTSWGREPPYCKSPCMSYSYGLYQFSILSNPIYGMSNHIYHQL